MSASTDLPCIDRPENVIRLSVYKPQRGPAYAVAQEGRIGDGGRSFSMELFGRDRSHRVALNGNNTPKNRRNALVALLGELEDRGLIAKGHSVNCD